jgi:hypothetical protein
MRLIDIPVFYDIDIYKKLIEDICIEYSKYEEIKSIYQIGSVKTPGISDLDFIFVFKDDVHFGKDIKNRQDIVYNYIILHNPFGISEKHWNIHNTFSLFSGYKHIYGKNNLQKDYKSPAPRVQIQIALEYILRFFITLSMQIQLNVLKVRSLLLEVTALVKDLEILNTPLDELDVTLKQLLYLRENWFLNKDNYSKFKLNITDFYIQLKSYLPDLLTQFSFYIPVEEHINYLKNFKITRNKDFRFASNGIGRYFSFLNMGSKIFFNFANRFQSYELYMPWVSDLNHSDILYMKYVYDRDILIYNRTYLPFFLPLKSSFHII